ncbi:hypothetical protein QOM21_33265 [Streptomyces sp. Pv4-95]|uniref:hypothetical protein n=1 Tax=Streptomyces sp. Pv4-95 TaxID=3049543 RepID=UPI0038914C53
MFDINTMACMLGPTSSKPPARQRGRGYVGHTTETVLVPALLVPVLRQRAARVSF